MIRAVWSRATVPPILVPKAVLGEHGGAMLAASVLAVGGAAFGRPAAFEAPDPEVTVRPHDGSPLGAPKCVMISALAAGGAAAWVLLERP